MTDTTLLAAQQQRKEALFSEELTAILDRTFDASAASYEAREKLMGVLKHYAKDPTPYRSCVRDNMKRFGPGKTEATCATLKDIIRGTSRWRAVELSNLDNDPVPATLNNIERSTILAALSDEDFDALEEVILSNAG